ncbi:MAG TPA: M48 family metallopeptidase [Silvibacterium sp.]|nr:M48 family metallopeptidase [Silvibacterium sp.]
MPTPRISVHLFVCATLALAGGCLYAQSSPAPADGTQQPAAAPAAQQTPDQPKDQTKDHAPATTPQAASAAASPTADCPGPVLHRTADKGGDICSSGAPPANAPKSDAGDDMQTASTKPLTDPNVNPFKQAEPDKDGMMPGVKAGSVEDVNAVGTRNIGARGMGNWYSTESEIKMGKQYADEIEKSTRFISDPVITEYVNRIGQNIVKNSDCKVPFTIKVLDSDEINAMALPGGYFFVNSGAILAADDEAELAGVMAHETAHVCAHHAMREMTRLNYAQIASMAPMIFIGGWTGYGIYEASSIAIPMTFLQFSREFEAQADYLGIQYMYRAGYDPQALITFFEKIEDLQKHKPGAVARAFADHPQTPDRIQHSQEEIARILPPRAEYLETTSEFDQVKARLARLENKRRLHNNMNPKKPSLRRVNNNPNNPNSNNGDEPPTLHRRDDDSGNNSANSTN